MYTKKSVIKIALFCYSIIQFIIQGLDVVLG